MSSIFSEHQHEELKKFWINMGGTKNLIDNFIAELAYYMETSHELITKGNKKIEDKEKDIYSDVAIHCTKLVHTLENISEIERINILSLREPRSEFGGKNIPICDPLEYVKTIQELAKYRCEELNNAPKYKRQVKELDRFLRRFPQMKDLANNLFSDLFCILYQPATDIDDKFRERTRKAIPKFR